MPIKASTRRRLMLVWAATVLLLLGGLGFVFYFMHAVYEVDVVLTAESIPAVVRSGLERQFPGVTGVAWKFDEDHFEASFDWKGQQEIEAYFKPDGAWILTEFPATVADLPEKARSYLESQSGCEAAAVERVLMPAGEVSFEVELKSALTEWDCVFDADGNLLSRKRDGSVFEEQPDLAETTAK